ncbi:MAG: hypothetical protein ACRC5C_05140 [Bacilli bacterium]
MFGIDTTDVALGQNASSIFFEMLMRTDGRTTDMLGVLVRTQLDIRTIRQTPSVCSPRRILRETVFETSDGQVVSHNFIILDLDHLPDTFKTRVVDDLAGIGHVISELQLPTLRRVEGWGWTQGMCVYDYEQNVVNVCFDEGHPIPFKRYHVLFEGFRAPGFYAVEYFRPSLFVV